ncbi:response regulator transcription factor [Opitutus terrae]|uniref:Response regulator receiver protein n=1 Tax=Opitutus terrae (strain DSM 11246 / JCM 15787 / PB90-1) TaxID=452637 RepID=B1ZZ59_OPITP|nr:response regulator transcription factor [Opitutus terrae]ACB77131.1 response regulator receiver protein [Opitutus terrae PB90-1]
MNFAGVILLVDDEPHIRKYVSLILKQIGALNLVEASNGEEAVAAFEASKPDLVLLDISMPLVDGLETLRRLKAIDPECVVVMLTSIVNRQSIDEALALGAANYIRKDTPKEEIAQALTETIQSYFELE